jgi:hypothetical protein
MVFLSNALCWLATCPPLISPLALPSSLEARGEYFRIAGGVNLFQHTVRFGPYAARHAWAGVYHGETIQSPKPSNDQIERVVFKQSATFDFSIPNGKPFRGACRLEETVVTQYFRGGLCGRGKELREPEELERRRQVGSTLTRPSGLRITLTTEGPGTGDISGSGAKLSFSPLAMRDSPYEGSQGLGYSVELDRESIAAVELTSEDSVTLLGGLEPALRDEVAAICMALYMSHTLR